MGNGMDEEIKYYLIACGTKDYNAFEQLPSVETDLKLVNNLFTSGFGYERVLPSLHLNPTTNDLRIIFPNWLRDRERHGTKNILIFYYSGHGEYCPGDGHYLILKDTDIDYISLTALPTQDLVRPLNNKQVTIFQILYIIDTCYSQSGAGDMIKFVSNAIKQYEAVRGANIAIHVMAACRAKDTAIEGVLSRSLQQALDDIEAIEFVSHRGYIDLGLLVEKMNQNVDSNQRVNYSALGIETYARFFPTYTKADQKWENQRFNLIEKLFNVLNINSDKSLFLINSFLLVYEDPKLSSISNIQELREKLKDLSSKPVNKEICPLILFSEWCRLKLFKDQNLDIADNIDTWKGEAVRYRDGVQLDTIKKYARELWDKFNKIIELEGRIQILISPAIDKHNNTGLQTEYFHVNTMFFVGTNNKIELGSIYEKEESFRLEEMPNSFYQVIPEIFYYLPDQSRLEIEFFLPFALLKHSLEDIKFRCDDRPSIGYEYPVFINSFDRYFDEDFREIRDEIEEIKRALWENGGDLDREHYYIGTEPSIADLEDIVESLLIAVWSRNVREPITDNDLNPSEWKTWPDKTKELRRNNRKIALFWDDLYPKPAPRPRPLNTKVVESNGR
ncbi:caspase family protein [Microcystis aeruginosa]|uniref:Caspase family protein n=1 Tax=Microcystis aeruginosa FD4 TaxID=2686288 RepID=A0A857D0X2_MICAE|nr:caspase family protein [Microcystis aeruginosa FD4]